ncbi:MAG: signal peptidase I [Acidimicrobiales bacterium]|nr:signal peptidase I [Acidimicrobiales bacterium]
MPDDQTDSPSGSEQLADNVLAGDAAAVLDVGDVSDEELAAARAAREEGRSKAKRSSRRNLVEWLVVLGGALILAVVVRTFAFQTFWIPSSSMATTLETNDRVLVNKLSYRFGDPERGDVVVFERPPGESGEIKDLIKRIIGLPGEHVSIMNSSVYINGRKLDEPYTHGLPTDPTIGCGTGDTTGIDTPTGMLVPEGHVFVMGDNRTGSHDGRCFGPIDEDLIVGRAFVIIWPPNRIGGL